MSEVDIGIANKCELWMLESRLFPSKIGGKPAWLSLENLPSVEDLQCRVCENQMTFLCQVYAPYEEDESNFHRTIFIFVCRNDSCCQPNYNKNFQVFRSHLHRFNKFYSSEPPLEEPDPNFKISQFVKLCGVCGCLASKHCSKCKKLYCCRNHQLLDWKQGHKMQCNKNTTDYVNETNLLFKEFELLMEHEINVEHTVDDEKELEIFNEFVKKKQTGTLNNISEAVLDNYSSVDMDPAFSNFCKRISNDRNQILRYERNGKPLWIAKEPLPESIPDCEYCLGTRQFEFQIMPQMLSMLQENNLDWGVLAIYTCEKSCTEISGYKNEYIFKQDISYSA